MCWILIAEDSPKVASFLDKGLRANGYKTVVVNNGKDAIATVLSKPFELMILNLELPIKNGITVLNELRRQGSSTSVIIISSHHSIEHKVASFNHGADDYLTKPFHFEELLVRVRTRLQHFQLNHFNPAAVNSLSFRGIELNLRTREVRVHGNTVQLSNQEFLLVETFIRHPGQIMSREELLYSVWGTRYNSGSNIVDVYVGYLRKKLGRHLIETIRGAGYRFKSE